ncbi:hypothetical protein ACHAQJ_010096 [Trichoderma viride]
MVLGRTWSGRTSFMADNDILIIPGRYDEGAAISVSLGAPNLLATAYVYQHGASGIEITGAQG